MGLLHMGLAETLRKCFLLNAQPITYLSYIWVWIFINFFNVRQIYITDQKTKQLALQINLQCKSKPKIKELKRLYSVKRDFWIDELKLWFVKNAPKSSWYNISGRIHVHAAN